MLKQLGRLERTRNIIILGFAVLMAVSLVFFYAPGRSANTLNPALNTEVVAKVGSARITVADVARLRDNYAQMFGGRVNMAQLGGSKRFLETLIKKQVITQEAKRLGLARVDLCRNRLLLPGAHARARVCYRLPHRAIAFGR